MNDPPPSKAAPRALPGATTAVVILTAMNLLNYVDRFVPSAIKDLFKFDLKLTDAQTSYPYTGFIIVYMLTSPIFASLSDRLPRKFLIGAGVALWSLATGSAALAAGFWTFFLARSAVGIGEAAYATISPPLLADFYPPDRRNRILTIFYVAIPVGVAIGFVLGGWVAETLHLGWRASFVVVGLPGLLAALAVLLVKEPPRGTFDTDAKQTPPPWREAIPTLFRNREYLFAIAGYVAVTFASGALGEWFITFLARHREFSLPAAGALVGQTAVVGGLGGTFVGGLLGDWLRGKTRQPYLALCGLSMVVATGCAVLALSARSHFMIGAALLVAQFFFWFYNGPINAILVNSVPSGLRVRAFGLSIFAIHALGDAISPWLIGKINDLSHGNMDAGFFVISFTILLGGLFWLWGAR
ncbi:MAG TPA: MFS transporter, partial [Myxococcaceae bacterium]|nr:MFS transporter [Myxococcaceae bacterium]